MENKKKEKDNQKTPSNSTQWPSGNKPTILKTAEREKRDKAMRQKRRDVIQDAAIAQGINSPLFFPEKE